MLWNKILSQAQNFAGCFQAISYLKDWTSIPADSSQTQIQAVNPERIGWRFTFLQRKKESFLTVMDSHQIFRGPCLKIFK